MAIILIINGDKYEVSGFDHPGEGVRDIYLTDFHNKDVTAEFFEYHFTDDPMEMLLEAKKNGECEGIRYLGPVLPPPPKDTSQ